MKLLKDNLLTGALLSIILLFSLFLRLHSLGSVPLGFHIDEASLGYNGYSLLLTGKDENNNKLPLYIDMFGDNRPSGYHYLTEIPIKIFGLNEFSTRLPGAVSGALMVIPFFFLANLLFKNKKTSLLSSFLISIAPWQMVLSRASAETIVALFLIITGYVLLLNGFIKKNIMYFFSGVIFLVLSFFFYHTPRVFVPLLCLTTFFYLFPIWQKFKDKEKLALLFSFLIIAVVSFSLIFLIKGGTGRFTQVNIFGYPEVKLVLEEQIREDAETPVNITRLFHNKIINFSLDFTNNYFEYFSGKFLFMEGGLPVWYKVPSMGLIYLIELPFIILGILYLLTSKDKFHKLPLIWLLIAPVTAALTVDDVPNIQRAIVMFPMIELIAAFGFVVFIDKFSEKRFKWVVLISIVLILFNFSYFLHQYFVHTQVHQNWHRYEGFSQMMDLVKKEYSTTDKIVISKSFGGIYPLVLFYMKYDPAMYQKEGSTKDKENTGFGKFFFASPMCPSKDRGPQFPRNGKIIYIDGGNCPDYVGLNFKKHVYINRKDGTKAFRIVYE